MKEIMWSDLKYSWRITPTDENGNVFCVCFARNKADAETILRALKYYREELKHQGEEA